jgi:tetratricopeptide (TPR) repeat protein
VLLARALTDAASHRVESFEPALVVARKALEGARELGDPGLEGEALERLAQALYHRRLWRGKGAWEEIHALYEQALEKAVASGRRTAEAESTFHVGLLRERLGRSEEAIEHYRRSLELAIATGDDLMRSYALRHLAFSDPTLSPQKTLEIHRQVLSLREQAGAATGLLYGHLAVAGALAAQGSFDEARNHVDRGCAIADEIGSLRGRVSCLLGRGRLEILSGSVRQGVELCRGAGEEAGKLGLELLERGAQRCLDLSAAD